MVNFCAVYGCSNKSSKEKEKSFHRIPKVVKNQGRDILKLSKQRRKKWFIAIKREDIRKLKKKTEHFRVCSDRFVKGELIIYFDLCQPEL